MPGPVPGIHVFLNFTMPFRGVFLDLPRPLSPNCGAKADVDERQQKANSGNSLLMME